MSCRKSLFWLTVVSILLLGASQFALADNIVVNGGFELGTPADLPGQPFAFSPSWFQAGPEWNLGANYISDEFVHSGNLAANLGACFQTTDLVQHLATT